MNTFVVNLSGIDDSITNILFKRYGVLDWKIIEIDTNYKEIFSKNTTTNIPKNQSSREFIQKSQSMEDTIMVGDKMIITSNKNIKRGDIVIFKYPLDKSVYFIKRCVAVGGDVITIKDKVFYLKPYEGNQYVKNNFPSETIVNLDGVLWVKNPWKNKFSGIKNDITIKNNGNFPEQLFNFPPIKIEKDYFFMMGDNRDHSNDSRFWGPVEKSLILGKPNKD